MRRPVKQSAQLRRLTRRDRFRKPNSSVPAISEDEYQARLALASEHKALEHAEEGTRDFRDRFARAMEGAGRADPYVRALS